jgi:multicomponent Na+:H+ antiporter subunit G
MDLRHVIALTLLACGTAALLLSALALVVLPGPGARLHALSPSTTLGAPLVCLALALDAGPGRAAVKLLFVGVVSALCGPVLTAVIGRTTAREGERPDGAGGEPPT